MALLCLERGKERNTSCTCCTCTSHDKYSVHVLVIADNVIYTSTCHDKYSVHVLVIRGNVLIYNSDYIHLHVIMGTCVHVLIMIIYIVHVRVMIKYSVHLLIIIGNVPIMICTCTCHYR